MPNEFDLLVEDLRRADENARLVAQYRKDEARRRRAEAPRRFAKCLQALAETKTILAKANQTSVSHRRAELRGRIENSYTMLKSLAAEGKVSGVEAAIAETQIGNLLARLDTPR